MIHWEAAPESDQFILKIVIIYQPFANLPMCQHIIQLPKYKHFDRLEHLFETKKWCQNENRENFFPPAFGPIRWNLLLAPIRLTLSAVFLFTRVFCLFYRLFRDYAE